jgi:Uma2 family endonuclease
MVVVMNVAWTRAAEGYPRRAFAVRDVRRMIEAGVIGEDEKFELIEGEIVPVSPSHDPHERIKSALILVIARHLPDDLWLSVESSIYLAERTFVEPDLCIYNRNSMLQDVRGPDLQLVIEVADSTLAFDLGTKAQLYASYGCRSYGWSTRRHGRQRFIRVRLRRGGRACTTFNRRNFCMPLFYQA